ncbi:MAG TPA: tRNA 2-thiouridine(34) synthase MnmA [Clostridiales bacterium]|nr:tRNA 2-thiouridine(34) synthase MnmA [Clostridiales bacterium]
MKKNKTVVVGMSGGVDSSVAAYLLKQEGYNVIGLFMKNWEETDEDGVCTAQADYEDVVAVSNKLDIPYYTINLSKQYWDRVFNHFLDEYKKGRTPNPDVLCNREIKFGPFQDFAKQIGADYIATGHYCGNIVIDGRTYLTKAKDENKDQTYFLNQVSEKQIENVIFPLSSIDKNEVRKIATEQGFSTANKKDSTGICFIGERHFRNFLSNYIPMKEGDIKTLGGKTVGRHSGVFYYTIGQRKGLGIGGGGNGNPWFVIKKDVKNNILYVSQGESSELFSKSLIADDFNFITTSLEDGEKVEVRIRHRQPLQKAILNYLTKDSIEIAFEKPQRAIASGQYAVVYKGNICYGGGVIR